mgnify:CR=1 FL=1
MGEEFSDVEKAGFYKAIYSRRDVRSHFTSDPIDDKVLTQILNAAHHAPSVGFSQPWNFILIKDSKTKKRIKESFDIEHKYGYLQPIYHSGEKLSKKFESNKLIL